MDCPFIFEQEAMYVWDQTQPPPITIETASAVARIWGEKQSLAHVTALSFRLIGVDPWGHDYPMLVMFVKYSGFPPNTPYLLTGDYDWLAITPTGQVVEPTCEDEQ
jgi:hypothetical protein